MQKKNRPKGKEQTGPGVPCEAPPNQICSVKIIRNVYKCVQDRPVLIIMLVLNKTETKHKETNAAQRGSSFATFYKKIMGFGIVHQSLIFLPLSRGCFLSS